MLAVLALGGYAPRTSTANSVPHGPLSMRDRATVPTASHLAATSPHRAAVWLGHQSVVASVRIQSDKRTLDIQYRDGASLVILPPELHAHWVPSRGFTRLSTTHGPVRDGAQPRALVLEPFAHQLGRTEAQTLTAKLTQQGFKVDLYEDQAVTVGVLESMANYSVVYIRSHSNVYGDGDAMVVTGETDAGPYAALFQDGSVAQATVAGEPNTNLYVAIRAPFFTKHVGMFPTDSVVFINGCAVLGATTFWGALHSRGDSALIGWDNEVYSFVNEAAASAVFDHFGAGQSVRDDIKAATDLGYGVSTVGDKVSHLGYTGNGDLTLQEVLTQSAPTPTAASTPIPTATATATPTSTPTPHKTTTHKKKLHCKRGYHIVHGKCRHCKNGKCKKR